MLRHMKWDTYIGAILLGAAVALSACVGNDTSIPATARPTDAPTADFRPVTDIPIPKDATMDTERSLILSSRDRWTGRVVMKVGLSPAKVFAFYQQEMPNFSWAPVMSVQSDISVLTFTRDGRAATVQVRPRRFSTSLVTVTIAPHQSDQPVTTQPAR